MPVEFCLISEAQDKARVYTGDEEQGLVNPIDDQRR